MAKRECIDCNWCKSLRDSEGNIIYFYMDCNGGNYCGMTDTSGWCED